MYKAIAHFSYQNFEQDPVNLINQMIEQWRYNGQIIGREIGVTYHQLGETAEFQAHLNLPEQESLLPKNNNDWVNQALENAQQAGIFFEFFEIIGRDYNENDTSQNAKPAFQLLYTTHLENASPLYNGEDFCAIPLYKLGDHPELTEALIKWQENWQACDQLQMNGSVLEAEALAEISNADSPLSQHGRTLAAEVEKISATPTFYYLYRLGKDPAVERHRPCPVCGGTWKLPQPLHGIFHFKCDRCRLISNLSWEIAV